MADQVNEPIEGLIDRYERKAISRGHFVAALAAIGASGTAIGTIIAATETRQSATRPVAKPASHAPAQQHVEQHVEHLRRQTYATHATAAAIGAPAVAQVRAAEPAGTDPAVAARMAHFKALVDDYADDAVVEDPLNEQPIAGKEAIAQRKLEEMNSMRDVSLDVVNRFVHRDQVVAEWIMRGTHVGTFKGIAATGRQLELRGVTVVTRKDGKISKEALFYDANDLYRQLSS